MGAVRTPLPWTSHPAASADVSFSTSPTTRQLDGRSDRACMPRTFILAITIPPIGCGDNRPDVIAPDDGGMARRVRQAGDLRRPPAFPFGNVSDGQPRPLTGS